MDARNLSFTLAPKQRPTRSTAERRVEHRGAIWGPRQGPEGRGPAATKPQGSGPLRALKGREETVGFRLVPGLLTGASEITADYLRHVLGLLRTLPEAAALSNAVTTGGVAFRQTFFHSTAVGEHRSMSVSEQK